ncbi:MAG: hypothetical protein AMS17_10755 [Spirochaetes bacterium DG_61]|nr:MAG: hypothetical protein AMS17_10755 [Spirochaetes bacterium DG_61]
MMSLINEGVKTMESGMMLWMNRGKEIMTDSPLTMMESGRRLMKMGRMKRDYTSEDKDQLMKQVELMVGKASLIVKEGEFMQ